MSRTGGRNFATTITVAPLSDTGSSITVQDASVFVDGGTFYPFYVVFDPLSETNREVMRISEITGNVLTISDRYLEGSLALSGISHDAGVEVANRVVQQYVNDVWEALKDTGATDSDRFFLMGG